MEHKTSLLKRLKNIFQEVENACGKVLCECKSMKERRTGDGKRCTDRGDNRE